MITSIVVTGCYNIGINSAKKIKINDNLLSIEKEIPFIRYRFESYTESEFSYIKESMQKFGFSTHLAEIKLSDNTKQVLEYLSSNIKNIAKFIYIDITDTEVASGALNDSIINMLLNIADMDIDRIMFKDKSSTLDVITVKKFIKQCQSVIKVPVDTFGVCSSPLSFGDYACLTAVKARELMSLYSPIADVALPSANHQCMNCCGCIRYITVSNNIPAPDDVKQKSTKKSNNDTTNKPKVTKKPVRFGAFSL